MQEAPEERWKLEVEAQVVQWMAWEASYSEQEIMAVEVTPKVRVEELRHPDAGYTMVVDEVELPNPQEALAWQDCKRVAQDRELIEEDKPCLMVQERHQHGMMEFPPLLLSMGPHHLLLHSERPEHLVGFLACRIFQCQLILYQVLHLAPC